MSELKGRGGAWTEERRRSDGAGGASRRPERRAREARDLRRAPEASARKTGSDARADAAGGAGRHRRARLRRHQDRRRRRAHRHEPGAGHLLLQDPRPAADRGDQVLRGHLVRRVPAADGGDPDRGRAAGRAHRDDLPARHRPRAAQLLAALAGPVGAVAAEPGGGRGPAEVRRAVAGGHPLHRAGRPGGRRVRVRGRGRLHDHAVRPARRAGRADRARRPGGAAAAHVRSWRCGSRPGSWV